MENLTEADIQKMDEYPTEVGNEEGMSSPNNSCQNIYCWTDEKALEEIHAYVFPNHYEWLLIILYFVVFVIGLTGNFLVCFAVWRNKHLQTITNTFLVNLAVADFMVILIVLPPTVVVDVSETWFLGLYMCKIVSFLQDVSIYVSVQTLAATSVERWSAICHPLTFQEKTPLRAMAIILCIWLVSMCAAAPNMVSLTLHWEFRPELTDWLVSCSPGWSSSNELRYQIVKMIVFYVIPVCFMGVTYTRIAICLWESTKQANVLTESSAMASQIRNRQRTAKMLIVVVVLFVLCYFPVYLFNTLRYVNILEKLPKEIIPPIALTAHWLCHLNSAINPIVYCFMSGKFRKSFRACCERCFSKRNTQNETGFSTRVADGYSKATSVTSTKFTASYRAKRTSSTAI